MKRILHSQVLKLWVMPLEDLCSGKRDLRKNTLPNTASVPFTGK